MPERDTHPLQPRLMKEFIEAAQTFDKPLIRITGQALPTLGLRNLVFAHFNPDWMYYDEPDGVWKLTVPEQEPCYKADGDRVCADCRELEKSVLSPKSDAGANRTLGVADSYTDYSTGETVQLTLVDDLLSTFAVTNDVGYSVFPHLKSAVGDYVHKIAQRADERMDGNFRRLRHTGETDPAASHIDGPVPDVTPHDLRATFGTQMARGQGSESASPYQIAQKLGHADLNTVQKYVKWADEEMGGGSLSVL